MSPDSKFPQDWEIEGVEETLKFPEKRCRIPPAGGLGVSPKFLFPPRLGDTGG